jgi:hypothetical protein
VDVRAHVRRRLRSVHQRQRGADCPALTDSGTLLPWLCSL